MKIFYPFKKLASTPVASTCCLLDVVNLPSDGCHSLPGVCTVLCQVVSSLDLAVGARLLSFSADWFSSVIYDSGSLVVKLFSRATIHLGGIFIGERFPTIDAGRKTAENDLLWARQATYFCAQKRARA